MTRKEIVNYVINQNKTSPNQKIGKIDIFFKDPFTEEIDYKLVFRKVDQLLPDHVLDIVDIIYIGEFENFKEKNFNAMYSDGAIYIDNNQKDENDLIDDVIHEFAHAVEDKYGNLIYEDGDIEDSFLNKRKKLENILRYENYNVDRHDLSKTEFSDELDGFFFWEIGYEKLNNLAKGLFLAPYSVTSLKEYFARGLEEYYLGNRGFLKDTCPYIYKKWSFLDNLEDEETNYEF